MRKTPLVLVALLAAFATGWILRPLPHFTTALSPAHATTPITIRQPRDGHGDGAIHRLSIERVTNERGEVLYERTNWTPNNGAAWVITIGGLRYLAISE
jgi:hypothetical protein